MVTSVQQEASRPMVHQRQPDETTCWVAVVAMLADYPLEQLLAEIREKFGKPWQEMPANDLSNTGRAQVHRWVERRFGLDLTPPVSIKTDDQMALYLSGLARVAKMYFLPSSRGAISMIFSRGVVQNDGVRYYYPGHIVAYSDGIIFDPSHRKPISLAQFRHVYNRWAITQMWEVR